MKRLRSILFPALFLLALWPIGSAQAAPGDALAAITPPGPAGAGCDGIGVAFDGTNILYTCSFEPAIRKTDFSGADNGVVFTADALGAPVSVDAIAWDVNEGKLWGGDLDGAGSCRIWKIDVGSGLTTLEFSFAGDGCSFSFFDGLTVDTVTDTLYLSPDVQRFIRHMTKAGVPLPGDPIDFESLTSAPDRCPGTEPVPDPNPVAGCNNSGLAIGIDGNLFAGTDGEGRIIQIDPVTPAFIAEFATVSGRDEDLECGPEFTKADGTVVETILSRDLFFPGRIDVLEAPEGTCVSPAVPVITLDPPTDINDAGGTHTVTATVTVSGSPLPGTLVSFSVVAGPNAGQVSDPGECSVDPNCMTDANGQVSWTYPSNGLVGTDAIVACFTFEQAEHCAEASKEWVDRTAPEVSCEESVNPHGQNVPPAGSSTPPGSKGGQNEDGFYHLAAKDLVDPDPAIFVVDTGTGTVFGPFTTSTTIKYTEAPGATPSIKKIGSSNGQAGAVTWHITGTGDMGVFAVDAAGNQSALELCLVPPPPK